VETVNFSLSPVSINRRPALALEKLVPEACLALHEIPLARLRPAARTARHPTPRPSPGTLRDAGADTVLPDLRDTEVLVHLIRDGDQ
jgi:hypothetical protein